MLIVPVDDIIFTGNDEDRLTILKRRLTSKFQIKDLVTLKVFPRDEIH